MSRLQRRLRNESPHMVYMNCRNHRLARVLVHLMKEFPFISNVDSVLEGFWKLFHYSPKKNEILRNAQIADNIAAVKILKVSTTRLLTHGEACVRLLERFDQVLDALDAIIDSKNCPTSIGLRNSLLKPNTLKGLLLLADVLKIINILSRVLQERNIPFATVSTKVNRVQERIKDLFGNPDSSYRCWLKTEAENKILKIATERNDLARRPRSSGSVNHTIDIKLFERRLLDEIDNAFQVSPLLGAFDVFSPDLLPPKGEPEYSSYGQEDIRKLAEFYAEPRSDLFPDTTTTHNAIISYPSEEEVENFRDGLADHKQQHADWLPKELLKMRVSKSEEDLKSFRDRNKSLPSLKAYSHLKREGEQFFPNVLRQFKLGMIIPTSTAEVERGFNLLCTDLRSTLGQRNLEHLMRMNVLQQSTELTERDWHEIVDVLNRKPRRIEL